MTVVQYVVQHQQADGEPWRTMQTEDELHIARSWERAYRTTPSMIGTVRTIERRTTGEHVVEESLPPA